MGLAYDMAWQLQSAGVGTIDTDIFYIQMPETVYTGILVLPYAGQPADVISKLIYPSFRVAARSLDGTVAYNLALAAHAALHRLIDTTINGHLYKFIRAQGEPQANGKDEVQRYEYGVNFDVIAESA